MAEQQPRSRLGQLGEVQDALSAVGAADEEFSHTRPAEDAPWMVSYTEARHTGFAGNGLWELSIPGQFVAETRHRLTAGIATRAEGRARTRDQIRFARLIMATDDPIEAAALGTQALDWAGSLRSRRAAWLKPTHTSPKSPTCATVSAPWSPPEYGRRPPSSGAGVLVAQSWEVALPLVTIEPASSEGAGALYRTVPEIIEVGQVP